MCGFFVSNFFMKPMSTTFYLFKTMKTNFKVFPCTECGKLYASERSIKEHKLKRHDRGISSNAKTFPFGECDACFTISSNLSRHQRKQHNSSTSPLNLGIMKRWLIKVKIILLCDRLKTPWLLEN